MRKTLSAAAAAALLCASAAYAGGPIEPVMPPTVIIEDASTPNPGHLLVPLAAIIFVFGVTR